MFLTFRLAPRPYTALCSLALAISVGCASGSGDVGDAALPPIDTSSSNPDRATPTPDRTALPDIAVVADVRDAAALDARDSAVALDARADALTTPDVRPATDVRPDAGCVSGTRVSCTTTCGSTGVRTCTAGVLGACEPRFEICGNSMDDDCDSQTDEVVRVQEYILPYSEMIAVNPLCNGPDAPRGACTNAVRQYCKTNGTNCFVTGMGPIDRTADLIRFACLGDIASERTVPVSEVSAANGGASIDQFTPDYRVGQAYAQGYCQSVIPDSVGLGLYNYDTSNPSVPRVTIACVGPDQSAFPDLTQAAVQTLSCIDVDSNACSIVSDSLCKERGFLAGLGPVAWNETVFVATCVGRP